MTQQLATTLEVRRTVAAPRETVFQAWTDPEMLKKWWRVDAGWSTPIVEVDMRIGGRYRLGMLESGKGAPYVVGGEYREVTPPEKLVFTWIWEGPEPAEETLVTVEFLDQGNASFSGGFRKTGIVVVPVTHIEYDQPLWLVVPRPGKGRQPWYLLTNEPVASMEEAWRLVFAYTRRWQIEMTYRYSKTELAMESPRLWCCERRLKLLFLATLAYAFLLSLLKLACPEVVEGLLRNWCHRTGERYRQFAIPFYRLRSALSRLWLTYRPSPHFLFQNSG